MKLLDKVGRISVGIGQITGLQRQKLFFGGFTHCFFHGSNLVHQLDGQKPVHKGRPNKTSRASHKNFFVDGFHINLAQTNRGYTLFLPHL